MTLKQSNKQQEFLSSVIKLANNLRKSGMIKEADSLDEKIANYCIAANEHLYRVHDEDGDDVINFAHKNDDSNIAPAKDQNGEVFDIVEKHKRIVDVVKKQPTGKYAKDSKKESFNPVLNEAHKGDVEVSKAKDSFGDVKTLQSKHDDFMDIAKKSPTGKNSVASLEDKLNAISEKLGFSSENFSGKKKLNKSAQWWWERPEDVVEKVKYWEQQIKIREKTLNELMFKEEQIRKLNEFVPEDLIKKIQQAKRMLQAAHTEFDIYSKAKQKFESIYGKTVEEKKQDSVKLQESSKTSNEKSLMNIVAGKIGRLIPNLEGKIPAQDINDFFKIMNSLNTNQDFAHVFMDVQSSIPPTVRSIEDLDGFIMSWENWLKQSTASINEVLLKKEAVGAPPVKTNPVSSAPIASRPLNSPPKANPIPTTQQGKRFNVDQYLTAINKLWTNDSYKSFLEPTASLQQKLKSFAEQLAKTTDAEKYQKEINAMVNTSLKGSSVREFDGIYGSATKTAIDAYNRVAKDKGLEQLVTIPVQRLNTITSDIDYQKSLSDMAKFNLGKLNDSFKAMNFSQPKTDLNKEQSKQIEIANLNGQPVYLSNLVSPETFEPIVKNYTMAGEANTKDWMDSIRAVNSQIEQKLEGAMKSSSHDMEGVLNRAKELLNRLTIKVKRTFTSLKDKSQALTASMISNVSSMFQDKTQNSETKTKGFAAVTGPVGEGQGTSYELPSNKVAGISKTIFKNNLKMPVGADSDIWSILNMQFEYGDLAGAASNPTNAKNVIFGTGFDAVVAKKFGLKSINDQTNQRTKLHITGLETLVEGIKTLQTAVNQANQEYLQSQAGEYAKSASNRFTSSWNDVFETTKSSCLRKIHEASANLKFNVS